MSTLHEQARAEAEKRYPYRTHDTEVMQWQKRRHRVTFADGFLAGHEAASRPHELLTVAELDALPVGSIVLDENGTSWQKGDGDLWWTPGSEDSFPSGDLVDFLSEAFRVLYVPEEES